MTDDTPVSNSLGEFIVYRTADGGTEVQLRAVDGTVWLTQAQMAQLYGTSLQNISASIARVLADGEVTEATINSELIVRLEGERKVTRAIKHYNLDMVLAVGYRATSLRAVQFRQWATTVLHEYLIKGFAMNDARLKDPAGIDYFDELLERIRDIRASEKRFYQKIRDVFAQTSADYDAAADTAKAFFATIQNKLLYAVTGCTAAELVCARADSTQPNMGLTSWKGTVVRKCDVGVAKNYLADDEIRQLNRITTMYLDFAEDRAERRLQVTMAEWTAKTDEFLQFNDRSVLRNAGSIAAEHAKRVAHDRFAEFDQYRKAAELEVADREAVAELEALAKEHSKRKSEGA